MHAAAGSVGSDLDGGLQLGASRLLLRCWIVWLDCLRPKLPQNFLRLPGRPIDRNWKLLALLAAAAPSS
jgi:hypothetical protein